LVGPSAQRIGAIDTLRGIVMALMLVDHVREFFYLHLQVSDPMDLGSVDPALFFTRLTSHWCAPIFVFLTGLGAWCYGQKFADPRLATSSYLLKRGLFLIVLELTLINFAWTFAFPPKMIYLQVIWAIGVSMLALAALLWLPRIGQFAVGLLIVAGHHLLDGVHFNPGEAAYGLWAVLHDRSVLEIFDTVKARTSYPVLPWIGVILLGYAAGPLYGQATPSGQRQQKLLLAGAGALLLFVLLRWADVYGEHPRAVSDTLIGQAMSWLNLTKYPPSLLFLLLTLGTGLLLLVRLERVPLPRFWSDLGRVPMFFYVLHLYLLHGLHLLFQAVFGSNQATRYGFDQVWQIWLMAALVLLAIYPLCRSFAAYKREHPGGWQSYF
jgi:uncharacterized membrane protein